MSDGKRIGRRHWVQYKHLPESRSKRLLAWIIAHLNSNCKMILNSSRKMCCRVVFHLLCSGNQQLNIRHPVLVSFLSVRLSGWRRFSVDVFYAIACEIGNISYNPFRNRMSTSKSSSKCLHHTTSGCLYHFQIRSSRSNIHISPMR